MSSASVAGDSAQPVLEAGRGTERCRRPRADAEAGHCDTEAAAEGAARKELGHGYLEGSMHPYLQTGITRSLVEQALAVKDYLFRVTIKNNVVYITPPKVFPGPFMNDTLRGEPHNAVMMLLKLVCRCTAQWRCPACSDVLPPQPPATLPVPCRAAPPRPLRRATHTRPVHACTQVPGAGC